MLGLVDVPELLCLLQPRPQQLRADFIAHMRALADATAKARTSAPEVILPPFRFLSLPPFLPSYLNPCALSSCWKLHSSDAPCSGVYFGGYATAEAWITSSHVWVCVVGMKRAEEEEVGISARPSHSQLLEFRGIPFVAAISHLPLFGF